MGKRKKTMIKAGLAIILCFAMTAANPGAEYIFAEEVSREFAVSDNTLEKEALQSVEDFSTSRKESEGDTVKESLLEEEDLTVRDEIPLSGLSTAQLETSVILGEELDKISELSPGEDYVENEACFLADSKEEALKIAEAYGAELKNYAEGVATLIYSGEETVETAFSGIVENVRILKEAESIISHEEEISSEGSGKAAEAGSGNILSGSESGMEDILSAAEAIDPSSVPDTPVYPNIIRHLSNVYPNDDPLYSTSGRTPKGQWFHQSVNTPKVWEEGYSGSGVTVAVIDSGIDTSNSDLSCRRTYYASGSFTSVEDENGHGTHCAGIIAGLDNSLGGLGIAPGAELIALRAGSIDGSLRVSDIAECINKAVNMGADIISMSFGSLQSNAIEKRAIKNAINKGVICVAAAGNEGTDSYSYPAAYEGVLAVGAYSYRNDLTSYSNYGSWVDLAAPGSDILSTMPDEAAHQNCDFTDKFTGNCSYGKLSGTSMATPIVAGIAALVKSAHPSWDADMIKTAIINSGSDKGYEYGGRTVTGGINALKAVSADEDEQGDNEDNLIAEPAAADSDYLYFGVGASFYLKAGKSVQIGAYTSLDTKKYPITYSVTGNDNVTVSKSGVVKVNRKANPGETAKIHASCGSLTNFTNLTVIDPKTPSTKFKLKVNGTNTISAVSGIGTNTTTIIMTARDADRPYRTVITGGTALFTGNNKTEGCSNIGGEKYFKIKATKPGTATVTIYATDGSGYKASIKVKCVAPMSGINILANGVPINGKITMARGASQSLKAQALGVGQTKPTERVKFTWSGQNTSKSGKITTKKDSSSSFTVTLQGVSQTNALSRSLSVSPSIPGKICYLGYHYLNDKKMVYKYVNSVKSGATSTGEPYYVGKSYGISQMPNLYNVLPEEGAASGLLGPYGYTLKSGKSVEHLAKSQFDYSTNSQGLYTISVSGPSVLNVNYGTYGVESFTPGKKGAYKFIFTSLDGSKQKFTISFNVIDNPSTRDISSNIVQEPGYFEL